MKSTKTTAKKIICFIAAMAAVFAMLPWSAVGIVARAADAPYYSDTVHSFAKPDQPSQNFEVKIFKIANPNFAEGSVSEFSASVTGWTAANTAANAITGVVNTNLFGSFRDDQKLADLEFMQNNPGARSGDGSPNVLVMANKSANGTASASFSQGLGEFWANGYFCVEVDFYAVDGVSAVYLVPETDFADERKIPSVAVYNRDLNPGWKTATFLVKTDLLDAISFKLELCLGTHEGATGGVVYYDDVRVYGYSAAYFAQTFEAAKTANKAGTCVVDLSEAVNPNQQNIVPLGTPIYENFDNSASMKFKMPETTNVAPFASLTDTNAIPSRLNIKEADVRILGNTAHAGNKGVMLLSAVDASATAKYSYKVGGKNIDTITWNRGEIYMINFYVLSGGQSYFRIRDYRDDENAKPEDNFYNSGFMPIKTASTSAAASQNNWILNTVFVLGESLEDIQTSFEFWVGEDSPATGYLMVDDFSVSRVSAQYYNAHKSASNVSECKLEWRSPTPTIDNSYFNYGTKRSNLFNATNSSAFPLIADGWEVTVEGETVTDHLAEGRIINGIVNTQSDHWSKNNATLTNGFAYGNAINPDKEFKNNNIYMMQNFAVTYQKLASNSFTLSGDTRNIISFDAIAQGVRNEHRNSSQQVWAIIEVGGREVTRVQIAETGSWKTYSIAIQTSKFSGPQARITFALGTETEQTTGCLFLDNVEIEQAVSGNIEATVEVDLGDPSKLYLRGTDAKQTEFESLFFVPEDPNDASALYCTKLSASKPDFLNISTSRAAHTTVTNTMTERLTEETVYEYIVKVHPSSNAEFFALTDTENADTDVDYGVSIRIKGMDGGFENFKTADFQKIPFTDDSNYYKELRFLIKSGIALDLALEIEFGNADVLVDGTVGILGLELKTYEGDFEAAVAAAAKNINTNTRIITTSKAIDDKDGDDEKGPGQSLDFLIIPSLFTGAAVIVAIVGTVIRRMKFKKHIGKQHTSYARDDFETAIPKKELKTPTAKKAPKTKQEDKK